MAVASIAGIGWEQRLDELSELLAATDAEAVAPGRPARTRPIRCTLVQAGGDPVRQAAWPVRRCPSYGVRVNTVSPGPVETPILADFEQTMGKEILDVLRDTYGRHGTVEDVVPVIAFLASDAAQWINGQDLHVDSGFVTAMTAGAPIALDGTVQQYITVQDSSTVRRWRSAVESPVQDLTIDEPIDLRDPYPMFARRSGARAGSSADR